jgi:hypothetical protein
MTDEPYTLCPYCNERIDPGDPTAVYAVERREVVTMGPTRTMVDGIGGFFHPYCPPDAVGYVPRERPGSAA